MTREMLCSTRGDVLEHYSHIGRIIACTPYGNGHINDTFLVLTDNSRYILQRVNSAVFPNPDEIMQNIALVTAHIHKKAVAEGNDVKRCTMQLIMTDIDMPFVKDILGSYWRMYDFIEGTVARDRVESAQDFYVCAKAFGNFQRLLSDFPAHTLFEPIKNFHNTEVRYQNLMDAVQRDAAGRAELVGEQIEFAKSREELASSFEKARARGKLPLRVTHNDTKLNNILFDALDGSAVCVIDLDTVMPGYSVNDFGDSIRFGANTAAEDETDLSKVSLNLELFEAYVDGFLSGAGGQLTESEIELLPLGAIMMTFECGMRFLTDYLDGDVYFKIHREGHNLDRCKNQFALVVDMEKKLDSMKAIVRKYL